MEFDQNGFTPDNIFDGGDLDCGSGLILLIRQHMQQTPVGGTLEMRSREPSVATDLPPWCRMAGHEYLGQAEGDGFSRYFIMRGGSVTNEKEALEKDKEDAQNYQWRLRARAKGHLTSAIYCRNFSFDTGQSASFEKKDHNPCAIEYLLAALAGSLSTGFATECAKANLEIDDIELSLSCTLHNILAHMGLEDGDPSLQTIDLKCFASTFADEDKIRQAWQRTVDRSPISATLQKAVSLHLKLVIV